MYLNGRQVWANSVDLDQTAPRAPRGIELRVYTVCHSVCIFCHCSMAKPHLQLQQVVRVSKYFGSLRYFVTRYYILSNHYCSKEVFFSRLEYVFKTMDKAEIFKNFVMEPDFLRPSRRILISDRVLQVYVFVSLLSLSISIFLPVNIRRRESSESTNVWKCYQQCKEWPMWSCRGNIYRIRIRNTGYIVSCLFWCAQIRFKTHSYSSMEGLSGFTLYNTATQKNNRAQLEYPTGNAADL